RHDFALPMLHRHATYRTGFVRNDLPVRGRVWMEIPPREEMQLVAFRVEQLDGGEVRAHDRHRCIDDLVVQSFAAFVLNEDATDSLEKLGVFQFASDLRAALAQRHLGPRSLDLAPAAMSDALE